MRVYLCDFGGPWPPRLEGDAAKPPQHGGPPAPATGALHFVAVMGIPKVSGVHTTAHRRSKQGVCSILCEQVQFIWAAALPELISFNLPIAMN